MSDGKCADVLGAVRCCRREWCDVCPMQSEICDKLCVEMVDVPAELLDRIEQVLEQQNDCNKRIARKEEEHESTANNHDCFNRNQFGFGTDTARRNSAYKAQLL